VGEVTRKKEPPKNVKYRRDTKGAQSLPQSKKPLIKAQGMTREEAQPNRKEKERNTGGGKKNLLRHGREGRISRGRTWGLWQLFRRVGC